MNWSINTPEGTRDRLFAECRERRQVQGRLTELFARRGYVEVMTPELEFYDLLLQAGTPMPQEQMLKLIDRSGKIMVMRPDSTTPIARVAATKLSTVPLPQRLYYDQTVFRASREHRGGSTEIAQCGVELIGASGRKADLEMVAMAVDALRSCGVERFHVELGHVGFFRELTARVDMSEDTVERMRALIEEKNFAALGDLLEPYAGQSACLPLRRLTHLFGGAEVLEEAERLSGGSEAVEYLKGLYAELETAGYGAYIRFDLGLVHQIDYYTGVVFRGYVEGAGDAVLSGGRYDHLVGALGRSAQATGFAVDVDAVAACLPGVAVSAVETLVHFEAGELARALSAVDSREAGSCELSPCRTLESTLRLAREKGAVQVLVLEDGKERMVQL